MKFSQRQIRDFQNAWEDDFGEEISAETAEFELKRLITALDLMREFKRDLANIVSKKSSPDESSIKPHKRRQGM